MTTKREKFTSQADADLLAALRELAKQDGRPFQDVLEDAMRDYIAAHSQNKPRPAVMAHFQASVERNRKLGKLLAK